MRNAAPELPAHVLSAFQLDGTEGEPLGWAWGGGTRFGRAVVSPASAASAWSGKVREKIDSGAALRVARPVRATDGRLIVGGYTATEFAEGEPRQRIDEAVAAALYFDEAMSPFDPPADYRGEPRAEADRAMWRDAPSAPGGVVAHLDFLSCLLFAGDGPATLTDIVPSAGLRPRGYTAAIVLVDGLLAGAVDAAVIDRWAHVPSLRDLAQRALDYRVSCVDPAYANMRSKIEWVGSLLVSD